MRGIFRAGGGNYLLGGALLLAAGYAGAQESGTVAQESGTVAQDAVASVDAEHAQLFEESRFPSATTCATCHPDHYREWSVSPHSYAQLSPVFNAFQGTVIELTNGTNGDFCIRCHTPVGMNLGEPVFMSNIDRHPTSREGITCIVCHRVNREYGKLSGRLALVEGDIFDDVFGTLGSEELDRVIDSREFAVNDERGKAGRSIHAGAQKFFQLDKPGFCGTCHDVNLVNGFRLEEAFSEYKTSPAPARGVTCQDCHMGKDPGKPSGYEEAAVASIGGRPTKPRKRTNHMFVGPDYSIVHPGIFPHNTKAQELATLSQWLDFDHEAGWGTDEFENDVDESTAFPEHWRAIDDRYDARDIIQENQDLLAFADGERLKVLRAGYGLGMIEIVRASDRGLEFQIDVNNLTDGHGVPTGFDAERLVFLQTTVEDRHRNIIFVSGDLDPNGDVRDLHSLYVHNGELPLDKQLFSLQSRFITRMVRGGDREQVLAINYSPSPLIFLRPSMVSTVLTGRPPGVRKHKQGIDPLGKRVARYKVKSSQLTGEWPYRIRVRLIAGMVPVNLLTEIDGVGFDYFMSTREVAERVVAGHQVVWEREARVEKP